MSRSFWRYQICKRYQNITSKLVFLIIFRIYCHFWLFYLSDWKFVHLMPFTSTKQNVHVQTIGHASKVLLTRQSPIGIRFTICPGLLKLNVAYLMYSLIWAVRAPLLKSIQVLLVSSILSFRKVPWKSYSFSSVIFLYFVNIYSWFLCSPF